MFPQGHKHNTWLFFLLQAGHIYCSGLVKCNLACTTASLSETSTVKCSCCAGWWPTDGDTDRVSATSLANNCWLFAPFHECESPFTLRAVLNPSGGTVYSAILYLSVPCLLVFLSNYFQGFSEGFFLSCLTSASCEFLPWGFYCSALMTAHWNLNLDSHLGGLLGFTVIIPWLALILWEKNPERSFHLCEVWWQASKTWQWG